MRFEQLLRSVDANLPAPDVDRLWKFADKDSSGALSQVEFEGLFVRASAEQQERAAQELLAKLHSVMQRNGLTPKGVYERLAAGKELQQPLSRKTALRRRRLGPWWGTDDSDMKTTG